jgi:TusE/DsrC/DsvC family sulfur relay protein
MAESMDDILHPGNESSKDGAFPHAPAGWTREAAVAMASEEGLELDQEHWEMLRALQDYFSKHEDINARELHDALDERFHAAGGIKHLYHLFPGGPLAQGCRIAGLEPPAGAINRSFGSVM